MRLRKIPYAKQYLTEVDQVIELTDSSKLLDLDKKKEIELEIGCGKGDFSIKRATMHSKKEYYALEKYDSVLLKAVQKFEKEPLENLKFILGDAKDLPYLFPQKSVDKIYLNFSDPWPKKKHAKRRLTFRDKLKIYESLLKPSGVVEIKTDNQSLFESTISELSIEHWEIQEISLNLYDDDRFKNIKAFQTEYEKKFVKEEKIIYYLKAKKIN